MNLTKEQKIILLVAILIFGGAFLVGVIDEIINDDSNQNYNFNQTVNSKTKKDNKDNTVSKDKKHNLTTKGKTSPTSPKAEFDIEISLKEMSEVYYNNELDGNKQFFGKKIKTQAIFEETSNGMFSGLIAYFKGENSIYDIHCTSFDKETKENLSTFNRNEKVNIIGTVDELVSSSIKLKDCKIYK